MLGQCSPGLSEALIMKALLQLLPEQLRGLAVAGSSPPHRRLTCSQEGDRAVTAHSVLSTPAVWLAEDGEYWLRQDILPVGSL